MKVVSTMGGAENWALVEHAVATAIAHQFRRDESDLGAWADSLLATLRWQASPAYREGVSEAKGPDLTATTSASEMLARLRS